MAVILVHWQHFIVDKSSSKTDFPLYATLKMFYNDGGFAVQYFFQLSGFIFFWLYYDKVKNKLISFKSFSIARFSRLYPLHFITLVICVLLQLVYIQQNNTTFVYDNFDFEHFLYNLLFIQNWGLSGGLSFNGPSWSVSVEILLYIAFFVFARKKIGSFITCFIVAFIGFFLEIKTGVAVGFFHGVISFFMGGCVYYIFKFLFIRKIDLRDIVMLAAIVLWLIVILYYYLEVTESLMSFLDNRMIIYLFVKFLSFFPSFILMPLTLMFFVYLDIKNNHVFKKIAWFGNITYSSYLLHFPLQIVFMLLMSWNLFPNDFYNNLFFLILFFAILIPLSLLSYLKLEMPIQTYIRMRFKK